MNTEPNLATIDTELSEVVTRLGDLERQAGQLALDALRETDSVTRRQAQVDVDRMTGDIERLKARRTVLERAKEELSRPERAAARAALLARVDEGRREMRQATPPFEAAAQRVDDLAAEYAEALADLEAREGQFRRAYSMTQAVGGGRGSGWAGIFQMHSAVALSKATMAAADKPPAFRPRSVADLVRAGIANFLQQAGGE